MLAVTRDKLYQVRPRGCSARRLQLTRIDAPPVPAAVSFR